MRYNLHSALFLGLSKKKKEGQAGRKPYPGLHHVVGILLP